MVFSILLEAEILKCLYSGCDMELFTSRYRTLNYSKISIFIQILATIIFKIIFIEIIAKNEKQVQLKNCTPSKFSLFLVDLDRSWKEADLKQFFETTFDKIIKKREQKAKQKRNREKTHQPRKQINLNIKLSQSDPYILVIHLRTYNALFLLK